MSNIIGTKNKLDNKLIRNNKANCPKLAFLEKNLDDFKAYINNIYNKVKQS